MKKLITLLLAVMLALFLAACGGENDTPDPSGSNDNTPSSSQQQPSSTPDKNGDKETVKTNWKNAEVKNNLTEDFAKLTQGVPEPESAYTINAVAIVQGLMFDLSSDADAEAYKQTIEGAGFEFVEEYFGVQAYENDTHRVQFSGTSITVKIK